MFQVPKKDERFRQIFWQSWRDLVFVHWPVPGRWINALIPPELEADTYEGKAYVGIVPFLMTGIRPVGLPAVPGLSRTLETNVRTYVRRRDKGGDPTPAVWFFSLEAENSLAVMLARAGYGLNYYKAGMWMRKDTAEDGALMYSYGSCRKWPKPAPVSSIIQAEFDSQETRAAEAGSLEHFLVERYALFAQHRGRLMHALVKHEPYRIARGKLVCCEPWLLSAAGLPTEITNQEALVHRADDVHVRIGGAKKLNL